MHLTEQDFQKAAERLGVEVAVIKAVKEVESGAYGPFLPSGRPPILFEGHIFWKELKKRGIDPVSKLAGNEDILYEKWTRKYLGGEKEYSRLEKAMKIHEEAALASASWGMFQIMGNNYAECGKHSVAEFVEAMRRSEADQLMLFIAYLETCKLQPYLKKMDWAGFARKYNGPAYSENKYDQKLEAAYRKNKN